MSHIVRRARNQRNKSRIPARHKGGCDPDGKLFTPYQLRVRAKLVSVAMELFHRKGYEETTVADIMNVVGKTTRTFFRYFRGKDDVAFDWMDEQADLIRSSLKSRPMTETPIQSLRRAFLQMAEQYDLDEQDRVKFLTKLILETPALSARYHHEYVKLEVEYTRFLARSRSVGKQKLFALNAQIAVVNAAFNLGLRAWVADGNHSPLLPWIEAAFAGFKDGILVPTRSTAASAGRRQSRNLDVH